MKKRIITLAFFIVLVSLITLKGYASIKGTSIKPNLSFTGTTANCSATIYDQGKSINATLTLKYGSTVIASWHGTGTTYVPLSGTASVVSGRTYTLEVTGTINGTAISCTPVTKTCP